MNTDMIEQQNGKFAIPLATNGLLAICEGTEDGEWHIAHIPTGTFVLANLLETTAREALVELQQFDWSQVTADKDVIRKLPWIHQFNRVREAIQTRDLERMARTIYQVEVHVEMGGEQRTEVVEVPAESISMWLAAEEPLNVAISMLDRWGYEIIGCREEEEER